MLVCRLDEATDAVFAGSAGMDRRLTITTGVLAVLAACFLLELWGQVEPPAPAVARTHRYSTNETVRDPLLQPRLLKAGFEYGCMECHQKFSSDGDRAGLQAEHEDIVLEHGANSRCSNCHLTGQPNILVDYEDTRIGFDESEKLCAKCHGPKYRDWKAGVHGRPNGYWLKSRGESVRATCVQCHSPHSPRFEPMAPAPGPAERRGAKEKQHD